VQIACGYGLSPCLVRTFNEVPYISQGMGPLISQLCLISAAGFLVRRGLERNNTSNKKFFRYIAKPVETFGAVAITAGCVAASIALYRSSGSTEQARSAADMASIIDLNEPITMLGTGLATSALAPWIEERIYRGVILQGLLPHVGAPFAVRFYRSSIVYCANEFFSEYSLNLLTGHRGNVFVCSSIVVHFCLCDTWHHPAYNIHEFCHHS
jgi:hypothetical protein